MRVLPIILAAMVFAGPAIAEKPEPELKIAYEPNTYRFGEVLRSERGTTIEDCAMMCSRERACMSWTLVPATFRMGPRCELKASPGAASHRPGAASGMSEMWQMDAGRHAEMRYQPRAFGEPLPEREPELMGAPEAQVSAEVRTIAPAPVQARLAPTPVAKPEVIVAEAATPKPAPEVVVAHGPAMGTTASYVKQPAATPVATATPEVIVAHGPAQGTTPEYVKQPMPAEPHPLYRAPKPNTSKLVFKDPSRSEPDQPVADYNAVLKRESQSTTVPQTVKASAEPVRLPWTERDTAAPDYSVGGSDFIPGDEDASAGLVEEAGS